MSADSDLELNDDVADISEVEETKINEEDIANLDEFIKSMKEKPAGSINNLTAAEKINFSKALGFFGTTQTEKKAEPKQVKRTEVIDDFIRNFMIKHKMKRSLEAFQVNIVYEVA